MLSFPCAPHEAEAAEEGIWVAVEVGQQTTGERAQEGIGLGGLPEHSKEVAVKIASAQRIADKPHRKTATGAGAEGKGFLRLDPTIEALGFIEFGEGEKHRQFRGRATLDLGVAKVAEGLYR